jgi:hypothetical protein
MGVSGQRHASAALYPRGKNPRYPLDRRLGGPQTGLDAGARRKIRPCRGSNPDRPIVKPVVRHYTAWATAAPLFMKRFELKLGNDSTKQASFEGGPY